MKKKGLLGLLSELAEATGSEDKVVKVIKMKPEWVKAHKETKEMAKKASKMTDEVKEYVMKLMGQKRAFWAMVESDTKEYRGMRINEKKGVIEVLE